jgi:hypothetical protein
MTLRSTANATNQPLWLSDVDVQLIRAIGTYKYMTAMDVTYLLYTPSSLTYVRKRLSRLAGGADQVPGQYLLRFDPPHIGPGRAQKIFTLGVKGLELLANLQGLDEMDSRYRPYKVIGVSYSFLFHALFLSRCVVAAHFWTCQQDEYVLTDARLSYELGKLPALTSISSQGESVSVIADAFLCFERDTDGERFPILFEADLGSETGKQFRQHIRNRLMYIQSPQYEELAKSRAARICYLTTSKILHYMEIRRATMQRWTHEVLTELGMNQKQWLSVFLFASVDYNLIFQAPLFTKLMWYHPGSQTPVSLWHQNRE